MPEKNKYTYIKVAKKGYLYNNEDKQEHYKRTKKHKRKVKKTGK